MHDNHTINNTVGQTCINLYKPNGSIISISMSFSVVDPLNLIKRQIGQFSNTSNINTTLGG